MALWYKNHNLINMPQLLKFESNNNIQFWYQISHLCYRLLSLNQPKRNKHENIWDYFLANEYYCNTKFQFHFTGYFPWNYQKKQTWKYLIYIFANESYCICSNRNQTTSKCQNYMFILKFKIWKLNFILCVIVCISMKRLLINVCSYILLIVLSNWF